MPWKKGRGCACLGLECGSQLLVLRLESRSFVSDQILQPLLSCSLTCVCELYSFNHMKTGLPKKSFHCLHWVIWNRACESINICTKKRIQLYSSNCVTKIFSPKSDIVVLMDVAINNIRDGRINPGLGVVIRQHVQDDQGVLRLVQQACQHSLQICAHIFSAHLVRKGAQKNALLVVFYYQGLGPPSPFLPHF